MSIALLYGEHGFNAAIFGLALSFALLTLAIRLSRRGSDGLTGLTAFACIKLAEGFFLSVALIALLAIVDSAIAGRFVEHRGYALLALFGGMVTSIDLLLDD